MSAQSILRREARRRLTLGPDDSRQKRDCWRHGSSTIEQVWGIKVGIEWRVRVAPDRVRVPDLAVVYAKPLPDVLVEPPLLVIEILSPDDSYSDTQERSRDHLKMGIATIWIIDPTTRSGRVCSGREWIESDRLEAKGAQLYVELPGLFGRI